MCNKRNGPGRQINQLLQCGNKKKNDELWKLETSRWLRRKSLAKRRYPEEEPNRQNNNYTEGKG